MIYYSNKKSLNKTSKNCKTFKRLISFKKNVFKFFLLFLELIINPKNDQNTFIKVRFYKNVFSSFFGVLKIVQKTLKNFLKKSFFFNLCSTI